MQLEETDWLLQWLLSACQNQPQSQCINKAARLCIINAWQNASQGMKIKNKHVLLKFLHLMRAYKFCKDCEIPASAQSFPALVLHRSCDKNVLSLEKDWQLHTIKRETNIKQTDASDIKWKAPCAKWKHLLRRGSSWLLTVSIRCLTWGRRF